MPHSDCLALHGVNRKCKTNLLIPCLLLIITLRFTCGERKIWSNIKKSQNIMTMIVAGLALTLTLDTHSQAESETLPHFVIIKTLFEILTTKQCDMVSGSTFNF